MSNTIGDNFALIAKDLYDTSKEVFKSEESIAEYWTKISGFMALDRTNDARLIVDKLFKASWDKYFPGINPIVNDRVKVVRNLDGEDYNLISQLALNLLPFHIQYDIQAINNYINNYTEKLKENKEAADPHAKKAKYIQEVENSTGWESTYNSVLGCLKFISGVKPSQNPSFRLSPLGSTPALTDSSNYSSTSPHTDQFIVSDNNIQADGRTVRHFSWDAAPGMVVEILEDGGMKLKGLSQTYYSKSGGDILNRSMFTRYLISKLIKLEVVSIVPRLNSVTVYTVFNIDDQLIKVSQELVQEFPTLGLYFGGSRVN